MVAAWQAGRVITEPGLSVKVPFVDSVIYIDKRILNVELPSQEITLSSQDNSSRAELAGERLVVDAFVRYRVTDALKYYQTVGAAGADAQLSILLNSSLRRVLGAATLDDVVRDKRDELMVKMRDQIDRDAKPFGIEVVDVRIRRADCRPRTAKPCISACKPSGSARRRSSAPRAVRRVRKFAPGPIAT